MSVKPVVREVVSGVVRSSGIIVKSTGINWPAYWANSGDFLFFGEISKITGGKLYNQVTGATDYLTVGGTAGSYTFQAPDNATYIAADTDYIWFKTDETLRTTTEAELVGYDLQRTPTKYDDASPNLLRWIGILKLATTLTGTERNNLFKSFELPILWDNDLNGNGHIKSNRTGQNLWVPEILYTLYDTFTDLDTTALASHTMNVGSGWTEQNGVWVISGNKVIETSTLATQFWATCDAGKADNDISIDVTIPEGDIYVAGIVFRWQDSSHKWVVFIEKDDAATFYVMCQKDGVSQSSLALAIPSPADIITLRLVTLGNSIKAYWGGVLKLDITDATYNDKNLVGLIAYRNGGYVETPIDNFIVM